MNESLTEPASRMASPIPCRICGTTNVLVNRAFCKPCYDAHRRKKQMAMRRAQAKAIASFKTYAATIPCRQCMTPFETPDKRSITRCEPCRKALFRQEDALPYDEARFEMESDVGPNVCRQLARKIGRQMRSWDFQAMTELDRAEHYAGIGFRRLTREEIEAEYTAARVRELLEQARANGAALWTPDGRGL